MIGKDLVRIGLREHLAASALRRPARLELGRNFIAIVRPIVPINLRVENRIKFVTLLDVEERRLGVVIRPSGRWALRLIARISAQSQARSSGRFEEEAANVHASPRIGSWRVSQPASR